MNPNAAKQAAYRARQSQKLAELLAGSIKLETREAALRAILAALDGNDKPLAVKLRAIATEGLA